MSKSKYLSDEEYELYIKEEKEKWEGYSLEYLYVDLLNKYGFNDGDNIIEEIEPIIKSKAEELARLLDGVCGFEARVVETFHNPYYVKFFHSGEYYTYHELPREVVWKIDKIIDQIED